MSGPLDLAEIDTFLEHLPQRREFTQLGDLVLEQVDGEIDFLFGAETTDGHAKTAVRQFIAAAQSTQHIAGLQAGRGTS